MLVGDIVMAARTANYVDADGSVMLLCNGSAVPVAYAALIAMIGPNLPQFGRVGAVNGYSPIGASPAGGYALLATGGLVTHGHTLAATPIAHAFLSPWTSDSVEGPDIRQAGVDPAATCPHRHSVPALGATHVLPPPEDTAWISPVMGTGMFIKAA